MIAFLKDLSHRREITGKIYQKKFSAKTVQFLFKMKQRKIAEKNIRTKVTQLRKVLQIL
jgi:hypothetical protein